MTLVVSHGGGDNSTAMIIAMLARGQIPDSIVFADTGAERAATYDYLLFFSEWLQKRGAPAISIVKNDGMYSSLEDELLKTGRIPSVAFGFGSCSDKWKRRPFQRWLKTKFGRNLADVTVCIGFDADEWDRASRSSSREDGYKKRFPLIEWGMDRAACVEVIQHAGLDRPGKSACIFCPHTKPAEIVALSPAELARALAIEENAALHVRAGLGRNFRWSHFVEQYRANQGHAIKFYGKQAGLFDSPCHCTD